MALQSPSSETSTHVVDVADEINVPKVAQAIGTWDILVSGAGTMPTPSTIATANVADYWRTFEVSSSNWVI